MRHRVVCFGLCVRFPNFFSAAAGFCWVFFGRGCLTFLTVAVLFLGLRAFAALPSGWDSADLGTPGLAGAADYAGDTWTVSGGGTDICSRDQLRFAWRRVSGDAEVVARVTSLQTSGSGQGGVMIRNSTSSMAPQAAVVVTASQAIQFQWRVDTGISCSYQVAASADCTPPVWVKLARSGDLFTGSWSTNGTDWVRIGSARITAVTAAALAGLAVTAGNDAEVCTATFTGVRAASAEMFGVYRELWSGLNPAAGNNLGALTNTAWNPDWPDQPDSTFTEVLPAFETQTNTGMTLYGQRLRAFIVPPQDGDYSFAVASDNASQLLLSPDETPASRGVIARVDTATAPRQWNLEAGQQSAPIRLRAGVRYYLEALMQQGEGPDNLAVRWTLPGGTNEEPLSAVSNAGTRLIPFDGKEFPPGIFLQSSNMAVADGASVSLSVLVTNRSPVSYQWRSNGTNLPGVEAAGPVYAITSVTPTNNGQVFTCVVSNAVEVVTSAPAVLSVAWDNVPPTVARVAYLGPTQVQIWFSEAVEAASATLPGHYVFTNGVAVTGVALAPDDLSVTLATQPLVFGSNYVIVLNGILDRASLPNAIATNTVVNLFASPLTPQGVGNPTPAGSIVGTAEGYDLAGGGKDIGSTSDQFQYAWQLVSGDFDTRVRVAGLSQTDAFAKAGLMARETLAGSSRFAAIFSTPSIGGCLFQSRVVVGGNAAVSGRVPVNYPDTWLRLRRVGSQFTGFASYDGLIWQQLGSASLSLPNTIFFGIAVCSHNTNQVAMAQFRDLSATTNATLGTLQVANEPFGPSSRRTGLVVSEIMYHPSARADGRDLEFVEIFNPQPFFEDISGYSLSGDIAFTFPAGTILPAGACVVVAAVPDDVRTVYGISNVMGPYEGKLPNSSGTVRLRNKIRAVLLEVDYDSVTPWPAAADGAGHSLVLARPSYGEADPAAWTASDRRGGSPGSPDGFHADPADGVVINEFLAHTDLPDLDAIELFNTRAKAIDLSGCYLTDDAGTNKFQIPEGTWISPRSYAVFNETALGFRLDAGGETLYLVSADNTRVLDAVRFEGQANGVSTGRTPDGAPIFRPLAGKTLGTTNSPARRPQVVINEIMYDPISGEADDQFVELYNPGQAAVDLSGWQFTAGISFGFGQATVLPGNGYLVVARNTARLLSHYTNLNSGNLVGNFGGSLAGKGERLVLSRPDQIVSTNSHGLLVTNTIYIVENEVTYGTGGRWGKWANRGGSSLELIDPLADNSLAPNWADSDETGKAPWTTVEATGLLDLGNTSYAPSQLHLFLQGEGECLVDNVEVFAAGGANRVANTNFSSGALGWAFQGSHIASTVDATGGYGGGPCLHLRATHRGDTGANRIRTSLTSALSAGQTATLRAKVRWLKGNPEILLRLYGNWLEAPGELALPTNPGTPGARNSRAIANAGPAMTGVTHRPVLPAGGQPVTVTAKVNDPQGVGSVSLFYRNDLAGTAAVQLAMRDDGLGGDEFPGDGIYSAVIPAQASGVMIAFYVQAADAAGTPATTLFPNDAPARECLVRFGETAPGGSLGSYRTWLTKKNVNTWASGDRPKNSNDPLDATFVYGDFRVMYNMQTYYSGSPFHTPGYSGPTGNPCDYMLVFPPDDRLLGTTDFIVATPGNLGSDSTLQCEQTAFWMLRELGAPSLHRRYVFMYVNGVSRNSPLMEDAQQPSADHLEEFFPDDSEGKLHKIEDWFEFDDAGASFANVDATLDSFTTTGGAKKVARYRWNWRPRATRNTATEFDDLFRLVDVLHATRPEPYTSEVESVVDVEEWMRTLALERFSGNWDSFGYSRGKNLYIYKPERGPWQLLGWDIDFSFGLGDGTGSGLTGGQDGSVNVLQTFAPFQRAYWRAFQDIVDGPAQDARLGAMLDSKYAGLIANGVGVTAPTAIRNWVSARRSYVLTQLANVAAAFSVNNVTVSQNLAVITGTAPVKVKSILFNGKEYPITWNSVTGWTATVPLVGGVNPFSVIGLDSYGQLVPGASNYVSAVYSGTLPSPAGSVVISEIMPQPAATNAQFVELYNASSTFTFDLSGWEFRGLSYTFPGGSVLGPNQYLVLAKDRTSYATAYNTLLPVFDTFDGALQENGETLTLIRPGTNTASDLAVAKVRYEGGAPWPVDAAGTGKSFQLVDASRDNWRAGNWSTAQTNPPPQWVYVTASGLGSSSTLYMYLQSAGDIYIDDIKLVAGSVPEAGANLLAGGDFETAFPGAWTVSANLAGSAASTAVRHSGNASLHMVSTSSGSTKASSIWQTMSPALSSTATYTLSFWYLQTTNGGPLVFRLSGSGISVSVNPDPPSPTSLALSTPGRANSTAAILPAFPPLWINEVQPENLSGITNRAGQRTAWIELFNPGTNTVSLAGVYLADNYTNLATWEFPVEAVLKPREFKVIFADGQTQLSTTNELHASFTLPPRSGTLALSRVNNSQLQVLDYLTYANVAADRSFGSLPDAQCFDRAEFFYPTPGRTNNGASAPLTVVINEWMADNTRTIADPADTQCEDWFELYNFGSATVDVGGYFLTDTLTNKFQYEIPRTGEYTIPPHGYLLVWADGEAKQNSTNRPDLHVNFKLDKEGEAIGLFAADGTLIDYVTFGPQASDVAMGRYPDGGAAVGILSVATPGSDNPAPNQPPTLEFIPDSTITLGQSLSFVAVATDPDVPTQTLSYYLAGGAPVGAAIDVRNGQFSWTPTDAPSTNLVTILVTDDGMPSLSASRTFTVIVLPAPRLSAVSADGNEFSFSFETIAGRGYQVEFKDALEAADWLPLGDPQVGTGGTITVLQALDGVATQRFFRVRLLP